MKKIKYIMPIALGSTLAITGCSCYQKQEEQSCVELSKNVIDKGVTLQTFNVEQNKHSIIVLNLPKGTTISTITIKIGDTTLHVCDVDVFGNTIAIPAGKVTVVKVFISNIGLYQPIPSTPVNFLDCEWSIIDYWCQKLELGEIGEVEFCSHFLNGSTPISSLDDFIGLERTIKINGVNHTIRVIDTLHDTISQIGTLDNKKAVFTFELATLLSDSEGNRMSSRWFYQPYGYNYTASPLRANLGGDAGNRTWDKTTLELIKEDDESLYDAIKPTIHYVATTQIGWESSTPTEQEYRDKLFVPAYHNITTEATSYCKETKNSIYKYYSYLETLTTEEANAARIRKDVNGNVSRYWLASAYTYYANDAWIVRDDGSIGWYPVNDDEGGVSFAFCV